MEQYPVMATPSPNVTPVPFWKNKNIMLLVFLCAAILALLSVTIWLFTRQQTPTSPQSSGSQQSLISGTFNINGIVPQGATIVLTRINNATQSDSANASQTFPAVDQGSWSLANVSTGSTYTITASVVSQNKTIATSDPLVVTAPADQEAILLNIPIETPTEPATISGTVLVNGYIPPGTTITVQGRKLGAQTFTNVAASLPGISPQFMSYTTALAGQTYEVVGLLFDSSGNQIGSSTVLVVTAPAAHETLTINSQATPPATPTPTAVPTITPGPSITPAPTATPVPTPTPVSISGSINFNGVAPANSRIVILQKVYNTQNYQVAVDNITPMDGTTWQWTGPQLATWYDIIAVLKQKQSDGADQDIATSPMQSIAAPASNITLTINSGLVLSAPPGPITVSCGNLSGASWGAQVSFASVSNAQSYWLQIGTSSGGTNVYSATQNSNGQANQTASVVLNNGTTYYAQYAYATTQNATQPQFSPFSSVTQFQCNN